MKGYVKSILRKLAFRGDVPRTFPAVRIEDGRIAERVLIKTGEIDLDISQVHCIVCHEPFCVAVCLSEQESSAFRTGAISLTIHLEDRQSAIAKVKLSQTLKTDQGIVAIFEILEATCLQVGLFRRQLISRYFRNKNTPEQDRMYGALYSYPRKVIAVSHVDAGGYNLFPMDFQCLIATGGMYMLGLRTTNITLQKILNSGRVVISNTHNANLDHIYQLGSHHSASPPPLEALPFATSPSKRFGFPVPDFATGYSEVELTASQCLGTHMLMLGSVVNQVAPKSPVHAIHHIHYFQSIYRNYERLN
jgi:flavin reductase (DIM6/NTAB) family NADH-FMN oxidoreductase RutF